MADFHNFVRQGDPSGDAIKAAPARGRPTQQMWDDLSALVDTIGTVGALPSPAAIAGPIRDAAFARVQRLVSLMARQASQSNRSLGPAKLAPRGPMMGPTHSSEFQPGTSDLESVAWGKLTELANKPATTEESFHQKAGATARGAMRRFMGKESTGGGIVDEAERQKAARMRKWDAKWETTTGSKVPDDIAAMAWGVPVERIRQMRGAQLDMERVSLDKLADQIAAGSTGAGTIKSAGLRKAAPRQMETPVEKPEITAEAIAPAAEAHLGRGTTGKGMSDKQAEVMKRLEQNQSIRQIAKDLGISPSSVQGLKKRLMDRIQRTRPEGEQPPSISGGSQSGPVYTESPLTMQNLNVQGLGVTDIPGKDKKIIWMHDKETGSTGGWTGDIKSFMQGIEDSRKRFKASPPISGGSDAPESPHRSLWNSISSLNSRYGGGNNQGQGVEPAEMKPYVHNLYGGRAVSGRTHVDINSAIGRYPTQETFLSKTAHPDQFLDTPRQEHQEWRRTNRVPLKSDEGMKRFLNILLENIEPKP